VFYIASGVAVIRSRALPVWLGWLAIVVGIVSVTPAAVIGFFGLIVWPLVLGILIYVRSGRQQAKPAVAAPAPA
jgi:nitrate reductase NapE component